MTISRKKREPLHRPCIGLNADMGADDKGPYFFSRIPYAQAVWNAGGRPVLIPPMEKGDPHACLEGLQGLLLTGGDDLDPTLYGGSERHPGEVPLHPTREAFDMSLVREAVRIGIPTLAICLGLQELCVAFGGDLHPYIADDVPGALPHRTPEGGMVDHPLEITAGSRMAQVMPDGSRVNSAHRQAVRNPGRGFRVAARTGDGVIEAVERRNTDFMVGVQWHPELMTEDPAQAGLFEALVAHALHFHPMSRG